MFRTKEDVAAEGRKDQVAVLGGQMLERPGRNQQGVPGRGREVIENGRLKEPERENTEFFFSASMYTNYRQKAEQKAVNHVLRCP